MLRAHSSVSRVLRVRAAGGGVARPARCLATCHMDNPYTLEPHAFSFPVASEADVQATLHSANQAHKAWAAVDLAERQRLCGSLLSAVEAMGNEIARSISGGMGKPLQQARNEIKGVRERTEALVALAPSVLADEVLPEKAGLVRKIAKEPVGVVVAITPWNYPLLTAVNTLIPAVLAGNAVIMKPAPRTALCGAHLAAAFQRAGFPDHLVASLNVPHDTIHSTLVPDPRVGFVAFTGSVAAGRAVYQSVASQRFIDVGLELGGKDPAYVADDVDVAQVAEALVDGAMYNAGQSCCAVERVYVHEARYAEFVEAARAAAEAYTLGDPLKDGTTMGPMALDQAPAFLESQVRDAVAKGAKVVCGGTPVKDAAGRGRFFAPTVLAQCDHSMEVMREESFGPVLPVQAVKSDEEALACMNDSHYGLTAGVHTKDRERAERMARQLQAGTVFMNRSDYLDPLLPWGGVKDTGKGYTLSAHGFRGVTRLKGYNFRV